MRDRFTITVTEITGAHHYEIHVVTRQLVWYGLLALTAILLITFSLVILLQKNVSDLELGKRHISTRLSFLQQENGSLVDDIRSKIREFDELYDKISRVEELVGIEGGPDQPLGERMELARLLIAQREQEFQEITHKVQDIEGLIGMEGETGVDATTLSERLDVASLTATQKRMMLDNLPSGFPITLSEVSSGFGGRTHPTLHRPEFHTGADIRAKMNTPVRATADGVVQLAGQFKNGFGTMVVVNHSFGFATAYAHLHEATAKPGDFVRRGEVIGLSGNSGLTSGPHLHYEVRFLEQHINPVPFLEWSLENYEVVFKEPRIKWQSLVNLINHRLMNQTPPSLQLAQK